jgi:ubiquinone/menaquinone biosynthesis C-methylase UbiE
MSDLLELTGRAEATHFWFRGFRIYVSRAIAGVVGDRRNLRIIECGCGTGYNMSMLAPYGHVFAFDLNADGARRARARGRPVVRADMERIPFASGSFDLATSFDVLQSVPDDRQGLSEIARVLRPGGHAILNVTAMDWMAGDHSFVWGELRRYTVASATRLLESVGLQPVRLTYLFGSLVPLMLAVRTAQKVMRPFRPPTGDADLAVPAAPINEALTWVLKGEAALARRFPLPVGSSLLIVAKKPRT